MKKLILGLVIGLTIGMTTNAFAAVGDSVTAVFANFTYVVNGQAKSLDAPVLVHDGNSYLRTTQVSNMLGYDVTYKADTRTIEFNNPQPITQPVPIESTGPKPSPVPEEDLTSTPNEVPTSTTEPAASPAPVLTTEPEPSPAPSNAVACQAIRDDYSHQIVMLGYQGLSTGQSRLQQLQLEYARDQELSAAGC